MLILFHLVPGNRKYLNEYLPKSIQILIFGFSTEDPFSSSVKSTIIIEVILTSLLKRKLFKSQCKASEIDDTIWLFFYIPENISTNMWSNYWNKLEDNDSTIEMRVTPYIDNGFLDSGTKKIIYPGKYFEENGVFVGRIF